MRGRCIQAHSAEDGTEPGTLEVTLEWSDRGGWMRTDKGTVFELLAVGATAEDKM